MFFNLSNHIWFVYSLAFCIAMALVGIRLWTHKKSKKFLLFELIQYAGIFFRQSPKFYWKSVHLMPFSTLVLLIAIFNLNFILETLIKTRKVTIDTSRIVNSIESLIDSKRTLVWTEFDDGITQRFRHSTFGSWQKQIWNKPKVFIGQDLDGIYEIVHMKSYAVTILEVSYL